MALIVEPLALTDVLLVRPRKHSDQRGYFVETYNQRVFHEAGMLCAFVQDNQSLSTQRGTIRGLHFQTAPEPQAKLVRVLAGSVFDVAVDLRAGSPTYGRWCGATLTAEGGEQLFIPVGFAHAFCTLEPETIVAYKVDGFYNKAAEGGLRWDDPDIAIDWPVSREAVLVSDKDAALPFLRDLKAPITFQDPA
jgi:dTDP-4-dehydrorhamnose 3,5-epimerase